MTELKPCPFCGGPAAYLYGQLFCDRVQCQYCGAMTRVDDIETVTMEWNQRVSE